MLKAAHTQKSCLKAASVSNSVLILFRALMFQQITITGKWRSSIFMRRFMQLAFFPCLLLFSLFWHQTIRYFSQVEARRKPTSHDCVKICCLNFFFAVFNNKGFFCLFVFVLAFYNCTYCEVGPHSVQAVFVLLQVTLLQSSHYWADLLLSDICLR